MLKKLLFAAMLLAVPTVCHAQDYACTSPDVDMSPLSPTYDATTGKLNHWLCVHPITGSVSASGIGGSVGGSDTQVQFNKAGVLGGDSRYTFDYITGLIKHTETGVFTNAQMNEYAIFILNSCDPGIEYFFEQNNFATEPISGCVISPPGNNVWQTNGGGFYNQCQSATINCVGMYAQVRARVAGAKIWGSNPVADDNGFAVSQMYGEELNVNVGNASSTGQMLRIIGNWTAQPSYDSTFATSGNFPAVDIVKNVGTGRPTAGFSCEAGSLPTNNDGCVFAGPAGTGTNSPSSYFILTSKDSGGTLHVAGIQETAAGVLSLAGNNNPISIKSYTVATLPSAITVGANSLALVTDASTFTVGTCIGGGTDTMIAISNGTTWSCH